MPESTEISIFELQEDNTGLHSLVLACQRPYLMLLEQSLSVGREIYDLLALLGYMAYLFLF